MLVRAAFAHTVWIEPLEGRMVVRFAEPGKKFEKSPGYLDSLVAPASFILKTNAPVSIETPKKSDHFSLEGASETNLIATETVFTVRGGRKPYFYGRWQPLELSNTNSFLTLDLVPTGRSGEVSAFFRGKPLPKVKATLYTPDGKETELTADEGGILRFEQSQTGQYLLAIAHHREPIPGFHLGRPYEQTSHNTALSWVRP
jgi:hypothetical protein